jgi:hypothetical protein
MLKSLFSVDEIIKTTQKDGASLQKMEEIEKKKNLEKELPIDPKAIFNNYKKGKQDKGKKYRQPKPETDGTKKKPKIVTILDY